MRYSINVHVLRGSGVMHIARAEIYPVYDHYQM